jgi:hypothetical protein
MPGHMRFVFNISTSNKYPRKNDTSSSNSPLQKLCGLFALSFPPAALYPPSLPTDPLIFVQVLDDETKYS